MDSQFFLINFLILPPFLDPLWLYIYALTSLFQLDVICVCGGRILQTESRLRFRFRFPLLYVLVWEKRRHKAYFIPPSCESFCIQTILQMRPHDPIAMVSEEKTKDFFRISLCRLLVRYLEYALLGTFVDRFL